MSNEQPTQWIVTYVCLSNGGAEVRLTTSVIPKREAMDLAVARDAVTPVCVYQLRDVLPSVVDGRALAASLPKCEECGALATRWHPTDVDSYPYFRCADHDFPYPIKGDPVPWDAAAVARLTPRPDEAG